MSYASIIQKLPQEFQPAMLELVEALEQNIREEPAARRDDFHALRSVVHELTEAQQITEKHVDSLAVTVAELTEAQKRTEQRVEELTAAQTRTEQRIEELTAAQTRPEQRIDNLGVKVAELIEAQKITEQRLQELTEAVQQLTATQVRFEEDMREFHTRQDKYTGLFLEMKYRDKAHAFFGRILRKAQAVAFQEIENEIEKLPDYERNDLFVLDLLIRGVPRSRSDVSEVWLAVEVSAVVDRYDVERAQRRAAILKRAGYLVVPAVAGESTTQGGLNTAREDNVLLFQNGTIEFWEESLSKALAT